MDKFSLEEASVEDLIRIWRPQAFALASRSRTPDEVGRFLESKKIPRDVASETAIGIWNEAQKSRIKSNIPKLVIGYFLIFLGVAITLYLVFWEGYFTVISLGPCVLGAGVLWGGYLTDTD